MFIIVFAAIVGIFFSSCTKWLDNDDNNYADYKAWGTITCFKSSNDFMIITDDSLKLVPLNTSQLSDYKPIDGQRVEVLYSIDKEQSSVYSDPKQYNVNIFSIDDILTKDILQTNQIDTVAKDGIDPISIWISNNIYTNRKYINIYFKVLTSNLKPHLIYLVSDASKNPIDEEGYYNLEFRHNANGDDYGYYAQGKVSFLLNEEIIADNVKGIRMKIYPIADNIPSEYIINYSK
jgi:hypothetical protein